MVAWQFVSARFPAWYGPLGMSRLVWSAWFQFSVHCWILFRQKFCEIRAAKTAEKRASSQSITGLKTYGIIAGSGQFIAGSCQPADFDWIKLNVIMPKNPNIQNLQSSLQIKPYISREDVANARLISSPSASTLAGSAYVCTGVPA